MSSTPSQAENGKDSIDPKGLPGSKSYRYMYTPSPAPGVDQSPFMTWGEIEGTPMLLESENGLGDAGPGPKFRIDALPTRERVGHTLSRSAGVRMHKRKSSSVRRHEATPSVGLSPAAARLLSKGRTPQLGVTQDSALRASYGNSQSVRRHPSSSRRGIVTPSPAHPGIGSKRAAKDNTNSTEAKAKPKASITDDLLNM